MANWNRCPLAMLDNSDYAAFQVLMALRLLMTQDDKSRLNPYTRNRILTTSIHACNYLLTQYSKKEE